VVVDGIKALRGDWFTFTNLWHTRRILNGANPTFDTQYDKVQTDILPINKALLIHFPENASGKQIGTFPISRHFQDETTIYQTISSFYKPGDTEYFVTILFPHSVRADLNFHPSQFQLLETDKPGRAIGLVYQSGEEKSFICVKIDLEMDLARENIRPRYQYNLGKARYGDFETDASYLFARIKGDTVSYSAATMTKIFYRNQTLIESLPNTFGLQLDGAPPRTGFARWRYWEESVRVKN
jgi:hypothetical protein